MQYVINMILSMSNFQESTVPTEDNKKEKDLEERQDSVRAKLVQFKKVAR